jgi:predicted XRE-type DNA-binding protein
MAIRVIKSSGNVFKDLGFPSGEAAHLRIRAKLMSEVIRTIRVRKLTQASAAKLFGVSQPRISDLKRGKFERFSIDSLVEMLTLSGMEIGVTTKLKRRASA